MDVTVSVSSLPQTRTGRRRACLTLAGAALWTAWPELASAQTYPSQSIRFVVPYAPGGGVDDVARLVGTRLAKALGQAVIIDNRGGAAGNIGTEIAARAAPDGYTIVMGAAALAINQTLYRNLPFNALKDFTPVSLIATTPNIVAVNPRVPVTTLKELIELAKKKPGALNFASAGSGTTSDLAAQLFDSMAGVTMTHVPYKGSAPAVFALLAGQVDVMFAPALAVLQHVKSGKLRALAMTGAHRSPAFPEIPTVAEAALPGFEASQWYGILVPAGTPQPIVERLGRELAGITRLPEVGQALSNEGSEPVGSTPAAFSQFLKVEIERWAKVIPPEKRLN